MPQAPAASCRWKSCGAIVVLPCGAIATPASWQKLPHHLDVVVDRAVAQDRHRGAGVAGEDVPALLAMSCTSRAAVAFSPLVVPSTMPIRSLASPTVRRQRNQTDRDAFRITQPARRRP